MSAPKYNPSGAFGITGKPDGDHYQLAIVRELRHSPDQVWRALTDPGQISAWAPFDANRHLWEAGASVTLTSGSATTETVILRAEPPRLLEFQWGDSDLRWELEATEVGTRLKLWTRIRRPFVAMGAAGWHVCLDVLDHLLSGHPIGRIVGQDAMQFAGWQRLVREYSEQFEVPVPGWIPMENEG